MTSLDLQILEKIAILKYVSTNYFKSLFHLGSRSNLAKRLKKMLDAKWIGRQLALEPLTQKLEFVYFLQKYGVENIMAFSLKFGSVDEIEVPQGHSTITHDLATAWVKGLVERDTEKYLQNGWIQEYEFESRKAKIFSFFQKANLFPDAFLKIKKTRNTKTFLIEMDNATENKKVIWKKFLAYRGYLRRDKSAILLFVVIPHSEKRLTFLAQIASQASLANESVYFCTFPEIYAFGIFSNIWTTQKGLFLSCRKGEKVAWRYKNISERDRFHLPL